MLEHLVQSLFIESDSEIVVISLFNFHGRSDDLCTIQVCDVVHALTHNPEQLIIKWHGIPCTTNAVERLFWWFAKHVTAACAIGIEHRLRTVGAVSLSPSHSTHQIFEGFLPTPSMQISRGSLGNDF